MAGGLVQPLPSKVAMIWFFGKELVSLLHRNSAHAILTGEVSNKN
jgi:hypothetical protein